MRPWIFISPASRGISHAITRRVLQTTNAPVVATARRDLDGVKKSLLKGFEDVDPKRLDVLKVDVLGKLSDTESSTRRIGITPPLTSHPPIRHKAQGLPVVTNQCFESQ